MKKVILAVLIFTCTIFAATAQLSMGLVMKGGYPSFNGSDFTYESEIGMTGGAAFSVEYPLNDLFYIQGDLGYTYNMITYRVAQYDTNAFFLHNLDLRTFVKIRSNSDGVNPYFKVGPSISLIIAAENDLGSFTPDNPLTFGIATEGGIKVTTPNESIIELGIFYQSDFTQFTNNLEFYKQSFGMSLTYFL